MTTSNNVSVDSKIEKVLYGFQEDVELIRYNIDTGARSPAEGFSVVADYRAQTKQQLKQLLKQELLSLESIIDPKYHGVFVSKLKELES
jgi:hypothetical protein